MTIQSKKLLTISIAAYNMESYLAQALDTLVVAQDTRLEVIVVNDGSIDNTLTIAQNYHDQYPQIVKVIDKANGGYGSTINAALAIATGKYFKFLDADDWYDTQALNDFLVLINSINVDLVITPYVRNYESGASPLLKDDIPQFSEGSYSIEDFIHTKAVAACALTYKTQLLQDMRFVMTENCFYTDCEYAYLPFQKVNSLYVSKLPVYQYRIGREGQSVSLQGIAKHYKDIICVCTRLLREIMQIENPPAYLMNCLKKECVSPYSFITRIPPTPQRKADLQEFDKLLQNYPQIYKSVLEQSKRARLLHISNFALYRALCNLSRRGSA